MKGVSTIVVLYISVWNFYETDYTFWCKGYKMDILQRISKLWTFCLLFRGMLHIGWDGTLSIMRKTFQSAAISIVEFLHREQTFHYNYDYAKKVSDFYK